MGKNTTKQRAANKKAASTASSPAATPISWTPSATVDMITMMMDRPMTMDEEGGPTAPMLLAFADQSKSPPKAPEKPLMLLGGAHAPAFQDKLKQIEAEVPKTAPVFWSLPRPDCIPKSKKNQAPPISNEKVQCILNQFLLGPLCVENREFPDGTVWLTAYAVSAEDFFFKTNEALEGTLGVTYNLKRGANAKRLFSFHYAHPLSSKNEPRPKFFKWMDRAQQEQLEAGILHRIMRVYGAWLHDEIRYFAFQSFFPDIYKQHGLFRELLDIRVIAADIDVLQNYNDMQGKTMPRAIADVAKSLSACGDFKNAAKLHVEVTDVWFRGNSSAKAIAEQLNNAGLAFRRNEDYLEAGEYYIRSLSVLAESTSQGLWNVNGGDFSIALHGLIILLFDHFFPTPSEFNVFAGLLFWAKFDSLAQELRVEQDTLLESGEIIRDEFRDHKQATVAIFESCIKSGTVELFRNQLVQYRKETWCNIQLGRPTSKTTKKEDRSQARDQIAGRAKMLARAFVCCQPDCSTPMKTSAAKWCPCHNICYCSKSCQVKHWKTHKKVCLWKQKQADNQNGGMEKESRNAMQQKQDG